MSLLSAKPAAALPLALLALSASARAQSVPPDVSVSWVGVQTWTESSIDPNTQGPSDMDLLLGNRTRWTLAGDVNQPGTSVVGLLDGRFIVDPGPEQRPLEWGYVRSLGVQINSDHVALDLGRSLVFRGGPRLVDGVQAAWKPNETVRLGIWGGLVPDLFTTLPMLRPGGGPIVSYQTSKLQLSAVGEVLAFDGGIDRAGLLAMGRMSLERTVDVSTRLDIELVGPLDAPRLVDGMLAFVGNPTPALRIDALYDAFSSYRYVGSEALSPWLDRFQQRIPDNTRLNQEFLADQRDPTLNHLVGGGVRWQPDTDGAAPRIGLSARYRHHPEPQDRYLRINPQAGVVRLGGMLDVLADVNLLDVGAREETVGGTQDQESGTQIDGGLLLYFEPPDSPVALDGTIRALVAKDLGAPGFYGDLFVNVVSPALDLLFLAGGSVTSDPDPLIEQQSLGLQAFVQMSKVLRPPRR